MTPINRPKIYQTSLLVAGLLIHAFLGWRAIQAQSPTFDEPLHLTAGYVYWKTHDYRINAYHHPPLTSLMAAVPLLFLGPRLPLESPHWLRPRWNLARNQYGFAHEFLYKQKSFTADHLINMGRAVILLLSCAFLWVLAHAGRTLFGPVAGGSVFFMAVFSPSLLAHGTLVTTDFLFAATYFLFFYAWGQWEKKSLGTLGCMGRGLFGPIGLQ